MIFISFIVYRKYLYRVKSVAILSCLYGIFSTAAYVVEFIFLSEYNYEDLLKNTVAQSIYRYVNISAIISCVLLIVTFVLIGISLRKFIYEHTGISTNSQNYGKLEKEYHSSLVWRLNIFTFLAILTSFLKCAYIISSGYTQQVFTNSNDVTMPVISAPSIEWIGFLTTIISISLILYSLYFFSILKDELKMKYAKE